MKKRKKTFHAPGSPMALSLQSFKRGWETNPESMELRRKRAVEKRSRTCRRDRENIYRYFVFEYSLNEITPENLERICYQIKNRRRGQGKWSKIKSVRRYLTLYGFIKYDSERDLYLNCYKIEHEEKERAETDQRKAEAEQRRVEQEAQRAEDERLRAQRLEADRVQREAQQAVAKPPQAHRETQPQQGTQDKPSELEGLKKSLEYRLGLLNWASTEAKKDIDPKAWEGIIENTKRVIAKLELKISELENCEAKCS
jgi:hypothetical protein